MRATQQTHIIHSADKPRFTLFGALHQFLVSPDETSKAFAMIQMIVPPGVAIPLHSHADPEVFYMLEGTLDFLQSDGDSNRWLASYATGAVLNVDGGFTA